ncbi:hypothetical protein LCGC14_2955230, partial [marine sediment metagenome]
INDLNRPTIIMAHNKTLAAQLYGEMKEFFPHNAVEYFVSYYDYYQPEAYVVASDTFIEKDASINEHIEQMRLSATKALLERRDTIIVASVSAIYGLGDPKSYMKMMLLLKVGEKVDQRDMLRRLAEIQYTRNDIDFSRGTYRVRGEVVDIFPAESDTFAVRVEMFDDEIERLSIFDPLTVAPDMIGSDSSFNTVPYSLIGYRIDFMSLWEPENIVFTDLRRFMPKTFTLLESSNITAATKSGGSNTSFIPGDILLGGDILDLDGTPYSIDLEVANIVLDLPEGSTQGEIDIFTNFIRGTMKFADGTYVGSAALTDSQVKVAASIQSFVKDVGSYDFNAGGEQIDETVAVLYAQSSGILRIRAANIRNLTTRPEL